MMINAIATIMSTLDLLWERFAALLVRRHMAVVPPEAHCSSQWWERLFGTLGAVNLDGIHATVGRVRRLGRLDGLAAAFRA